MGMCSAKDKARIVLEVLAGGQTVTSVCRPTGSLSPSTTAGKRNSWKRGLHPGTGAAGRADGPGTGGLKKSLQRLPSKERRELVNALRDRYPLRFLTRALQVPRSSMYYRKRTTTDEPLRERLRVLARAWPRYGYRQLGVLLRAEGFSVGDEKVRSLTRQEGLLVPRRVTKPRTTLSLGRPRVPNRLEGFSLTRPNQVWVADLSYVRAGRTRAKISLN